jgi:hypothetical protein
MNPLGVILLADHGLFTPPVKVMYLSIGRPVNLSVRLLGSGYFTSSQSIFLSLPRPSTKRVVVGRDDWEDSKVQELKPCIGENFRTLPKGESPGNSWVAIAPPVPECAIQIFSDRSMPTHP